MPDLFVSTVTRTRRRLRRTLVLLAAALALFGSAAAGVGVVALVQRGTVPARTTIAGVDVGGKSRAGAREAIAAAVRIRVSQPIRLLGAGGEERVTGRELGAQPLVEEALGDALDVGPLGRSLRLLGIGATRKIELVYRLGPVRAAELADRLDARFGEPAVDAGLVVRADAVVVEPAVPGRRVARGALRTALRTLPDEAGLPVVTDVPAVSTESARRAQLAVERLLDGPRAVRFRDAEASLGASTLRRLVVTEARRGALAVSLDPGRLHAALRPRLGRFESPARDARFVADGSRVRVVPAASGRVLDLERIGASLVHNLSARAHRARFTTSAPALTTEAAARLRITELVSEFTTYYQCCQPRVTNIQRAAQVLDGTIVRPGETFSLNERLGRRTVGKGYVSAPQIYDGRLEDAVGGGISQVATTLFNAAFFAGVKLVAHRAHQFYISRYPMGREATVSWGGPELIFRNDWPAALLVKVDAGETGIAVRLYSSRLGRRVETTTGAPYAFVAPRTVTVPNLSLPPGARNVLQDAGDSGFSVRYTRKVFRGDELTRDESYVVRYDAKNEVVEVGPPKQPKRKRPKPEPEPEPAPGEAPPSPPASPSPGVETGRAPA